MYIYIHIYIYVSICILYILYIAYALSVIWFYPCGTPSLPLLDQSIHTSPLLHTSKLIYHQRIDILDYKS